MQFPYDFSVDAFERTFPSNAEAVEFLMEKGILRYHGLCQRCERIMNLQTKTDKIDGKVLRCSRCKTYTSVRTGSFLERAKCTARDFLRFLYFWSCGCSIYQLHIFTGISEHTCVDYANFLREVASAKFELEDRKLGGIGCIVQIDESLVRRPKYHRGWALFEEERWVFGLYDTTTDHGAMFFVRDRSEATLLPLIQRHVLPGTEIHSDEWRAYTNINRIDVTPRYIHRTVNHSQGFINVETGVHTNNIEAYWSAVKRVFKRMNGTSSALIPSYLDLHMYMERFGKTPQMLFESIMSDIERIYMAA